MFSTSRLKHQELEIRDIFYNMKIKYSREQLEKRFPNTFEAIYAIMALDTADDLQKKWIKENLNIALREN